MRNTPIILDADISTAGYHTGELLSCPFCGGKALTHGEQNPTTKNIVYKVGCHNMDCWASVFVCVKESVGPVAARAMVVAVWNKRV